MEYGKGSPSPNTAHRRKLYKKKNKKLGSPTQKTTADKMDCRNVLCPVPGCGNRKGRGFRRGGICGHLMRQHPDDLMKNSLNYTSIYRLLDSMDKRICNECRRITKRYTAEGICDKCDKKRPAASGLIMDLTDSQREESWKELMCIQGTKFVLRRVIPRKLCTFGRIL